MKTLLRFALLLGLAGVSFGQGIVNGPRSYPVPNSSTGTTLYGTALVNSVGQAQAAMTSNTTQWTYIVTGGAGITGSAGFAAQGTVALCTMDANNFPGVAGYYVVNSTTINGDCHPQSSTPSAGTWVIGYLLAGSTVVGTPALVAVNSFVYGGGGGGSMLWPSTPGITVCTGTPCTAWGSSLTAPVGTIVGTTDTQTLTNKTLDGVSPTTMSYLDATSSIQTQLNGKASSSAAITIAGTSVALGGSTSSLPSPGPIGGTTPSTIVATSVTDSGLTSGNCVQASTGGLLTTTSSACGSSGGSVTTTGSPSSGEMAKFSGGTSITNGDLSGDVTTSGTLATEVVAILNKTLPSLSAGCLDYSGSAWAFVSCSGSYQTNGTNNATQTGLNFITSTVNANNLTATPSNPSGIQEKFEISGTANTSGGGSGLSSPTAHSLMVSEGSSPFNLVTSPNTNGFYSCGFAVTGSVGVDPTCVLQGVPVNAQTGTSYTVGSANTWSDRQTRITFNNSSSIAASLPQANSTGFTSNWTSQVCDIGTGAATITPSVSTISYSDGTTYTSGASSMPLTTGQCAWLFSDNTNYFATLIDSNANKINGTPFAGTQYHLVGFGASNTPTDPALVIAVPVGSSSSVIQTILTNAVSGNEIWFSGGYTACSLTLSVGNVRLRGLGQGGTVISCGTAGVPVLTVSGSGDEVSGIDFKHTTNPTCPGGNGTSTCGDGLQIAGGASRVKVSDIHANFNYNGVALGYTTYGEFSNSITEFNNNHGVVFVMSSSTPNMQWQVSRILSEQNLGNGFDMTCPASFSSIHTPGPYFAGWVTTYGNVGYGYNFSCSAATSSGISDVWVSGSFASQNNNSGFNFDFGSNGGRNNIVSGVYSEQAGTYTGTAGYAQASQSATNVGSGINITSACDATTPPNITGGVMWQNSYSGITAACPGTSISNISAFDNGFASASAQTEAGITINAANVQVNGGYFKKGTTQTYGVYQQSGDTPSIVGTVCDSSITTANCIAGTVPTNGWQLQIGNIVYIAGSGAPSMSCSNGWQYERTDSGNFPTLYSCVNASWVSLSTGGSGTVTSVATTSPITGGTFTTTGTIACATCVYSSASLATNGLTLGVNGTQAAQTLAGFTTDGTSILTLGVSGTNVGGVGFNNATSGKITIKPPTGALGTVTNTLQAVSDTFVYLGTTDTLTNKTLTSPTINAGALSGTFSGSPTFSGTPVFSNVPTFPSQTANYVFAAPNGSGGTPTFRALVAADIPTSIPIANVGTAGLSATLPLAITSAGAISTTSITGFRYGSPSSADTAATAANLGALLNIAQYDVVVSGGTSAAAVGVAVGAGQILQGASGANPSGTATPTLGASGTLGSITFGNATSGLLTLEPATGAITSYTIQLPVAQPSGSNTFLSCTAASPAVCTWAAGGSGGGNTISGTFTQYAVYYQGSSVPVVAEANASTTLPAICVASTTSACQYSGVITDGSWTWTVGGAVYVSDSSAGALTQTAPTTTGHFIQSVGTATSATTILLNFGPVKGI